MNVDSERCYPDDPGGVTRTVELLAEAGAAGFSIEDYNPDTGSMDDVAAAAERVAEAAEASRKQDEPLVLTGRAENHIRGVDDLDDTIARLIAYRDAGADVVYAPGLTDLEQIAPVVAGRRHSTQRARVAVGRRMSLSLQSAGVRRVSTGSLLAGVAYGALLEGARELREEGTSRYAEGGVSRGGPAGCIRPRK